MIAVILLFTSLVSFASQPHHWTHILKVSEKHEFYQNHENIVKPADSWQHLFSLEYINRDMQRLKDCVFFRVPGQETGVVKIKTLSTLESCDGYLLKEGDKEITGIKSLQFAVFEHILKVDLTYADYRSEKWQAKIQSSFIRPEPKLSLSSAEFKAPKMILLAPSTGAQVKNLKAPFLKKGALCFNVNEDCEAIGGSTCDQCKDGWYEILNGCAQGPRYCGILECGQKGQPACRRGMKWQRKDIQPDCRVDSSFAYCSKGLEVQCDGKKAFCR